MRFKMITSAQLASSGSEDGHQLALMQWCALNFNLYPELKWLHHSPNGGFRNKREAAKLKAMGVKTGFPDLFLPLARKGHSGLFIEMKRPDSVGKKAGEPTDDQEKWIAHLKKEGYIALVCFGWIDARDTLLKYLE